MRVERISYRSLLKSNSVMLSYLHFYLDYREGLIQPFKRDLRCTYYLNV